MVYGFGGLMAVDGTLTVGTLLALTALLARLYGPLTSLSNVRVDVMTALVSFQRVFEVLDLQPLVTEAPDARPLPAGPVRVELDHVSFRYPSADEVSLASLESVASGDRKGSRRRAARRLLHRRARAARRARRAQSERASRRSRRSSRGSTTRPAGHVRVNGVDLREATMASVSSTIGMVTQEAHLFHDTIRANLLYAAPEAERGAARRGARGGPGVEPGPGAPRGPRHRRGRPRAPVVRR